jgi:hypothetical protein
LASWYRSASWTVIAAFNLIFGWFAFTARSIWGVCERFAYRYVIRTRSSRLVPTAFTDSNRISRM